MQHTLPPLPYAYDALEPFIDVETMKVHHDKHHQTYITKYIEALGKYPALLDKPVEEVLKDLTKVPEEIRGAVKNHGGGYYHHSIFWTMMCPANGNGLEGKIAEEIKKQLGGFQKFKEDFTRLALTLFGSGWTWLTRNAKGQLSIMNTVNQDSPISQGLIPLLGIDVWEHAYYLKYQNRRADYIEAWWNVVNWKQVEKNYQQILPT